MGSGPERPYEVLGTTPAAPLEEVRRRYRDLLNGHHPDQGGLRAEFLRLERA
ncbi:DnaJ family molecular chaperone [Halovivax sp.]|uniref:J domain-containing protein n=1 Tax=Halovivax sp. TaxID=1935978 RepID=UPI0025C40E3A|nr:J domain-containing protein [Halovivax sp.]